MNRRRAIRVLLVDDHAVMRAGFRMILETADDITVVGEASTGAEAVAAASALRPDVICMDVQMPDMDGLEATRRIVADAALHAAVVIVTTFDRDDYLFQALGGRRERVPAEERRTRGARSRRCGSRPRAMRCSPRRSRGA